MFINEVFILEVRVCRSELNRLKQTIFNDWTFTLQTNISEIFPMIRILVREQLCDLFVANISLYGDLGSNLRGV